ncbi:MAG: hypothetical protein PGN09_08365 [Sphingomonas fennica]
MNSLLFALVLIAAPAAAQKPPKIPKDAPYCVPAEAPQLFLSPMGEPFRAKGSEADPAAAWFAGADRDGDGQLTMAEFAADARRFFATLDGDRDGALVPEEVAAYERSVPETALFRPRGEQAVRPPAKRRKDDPGYGGEMGAGRYGFLNVPQPIWSADLDIDRAVTLAEFERAAAKRFGLLDKAGAGALTMAALGRTPAAAERAGPCQPRPKRAQRPERPR